MKRWVLLVSLGLAFHVVAAAKELSVSEYRGNFSKILTELDAGHLEEAQRLATSLDDARVVSQSGAYSADVSIVHAIENAKTILEAQSQSPRIKALLGALSSDTTSTNLLAEPNQKLLDDLRRDEAQVLPPKDGEVDDGGVAESRYTASILHALGTAFKWFFETIEDMMRWLGSLFPSPKAGFGQGVGPYVKIIVIGFAVVLGAFMLRAYVRSRKFRPVASDFASIAAPMAAKDADPMSRDSNQWEDYAVKLASQGRHREAVRAWYHAVLAMLFRSGLLTYRKGRTNWEYFFSFTPDFPNRREFQELTGSFEVEWYGKASSDPEDAARYGDAAKQFLSRARGGRHA